MLIRPDERAGRYRFTCLEARNGDLCGRERDLLKLYGFSDADVSLNGNLSEDTCRCARSTATASARSNGSTLPSTSEARSTCSLAGRVRARARTSLESPLEPPQATCTARRSGCSSSPPRTAIEAGLPPAPHRSRRQFRATGGDRQRALSCYPATSTGSDRKRCDLGNVGLIMVDPIGNHLGGADTDKEGLVRMGIGPLNALADELDCMVIGVRHLGKDASRGALASVLGSTASVNVPRGCDPDGSRRRGQARLFHAQVVGREPRPRKSAGRALQLELVDVPPGGHKDEGSRSPSPRASRPRTWKTCSVREGGTAPHPTRKAAKRES